jgi:hypothetical protein
MLRLLHSLLDVPFQIVDRSIAACGSSEYGQTSFEDVASSPVERQLDAHPPLTSVVCGGWSTILGFPDNSFAIFGLDFEGTPVRQLKITKIEPGPIMRVAVGDTFFLLQRQNGDVTVIGDLPCAQALTPATKIFAKFSIAAAIMADKSVSVVYADVGRNTIITLPEEEIPHTVEPLGLDGVVILSESATLYGFPQGVTEPQFRYEKVVSVASTRRRTAFLQGDGRIYELIDGKPLLIAGVPELPIKLYAGGAHFGCVTFQGSAYAWGTGTHGQLGTGTFLNVADPKKVEIPPGRRAIDAAAGEEHTIFTLVATAKFSAILPRLMIKEPVPAGIVALSILPYGCTPPEFDIKF